MPKWVKTPGKPQWIEETTGQVKAAPGVSRDLAIGDVFEDERNPGTFRRIVNRQELHGTVVVMHVEV